MKMKITSFPIKLLDRLPHELWLSIFERAGFETCMTFSMTFFFCNILEIIPTLKKLIKLGSVSRSTRRVYLNRLEDLTESGNLDALKFLFDEGLLPGTYYQTLIQRAARKGHLSILKW